MIIRYIEVLLLVSLALISDIRTYKVKNIIIIVFLASGLITNLILDGWQGLTGSLLAALLPAVILFILFALRMLGAGDIKLFCSIGAISGAGFVLNAMACSFLAGGVIAMAIMIINKNFRQRCRHLLNYIKTCFLTLSLQPYTDFKNKDDKAKFRFSYAIACGTAIEILTLNTNHIIRLFY